MILFLILTILYLMSIPWMRHELIEYHKSLTYVKPETFDVILCFMPVINTLWSILFFLERVEMLKRLKVKFLTSDRLADKFFGSKDE